MAQNPKEVTWVLEKTPEFTDPELLSQHVKNHVIIDDFHFGYDNWPKVEGPCVIFGTFNCLTELSRNRDLCNYLFDDYKVLTCSNYYRYLYKFLGRLAIIVPLNALSHMDLKKVFGENVFIRPDSNKKPFEAEVVNTSKIQDYITKQSHHLYDLVVLSEIIPIDKEYRFFCRNGQVFCHSSYMEEEYKPAPENIIQFANNIAIEILQTLGLTMVTIDIAVCGHELKLIEIGGVNSWGIYGSDIQSFISNMEEEAKQRFEDFF